MKEDVGEHGPQEHRRHRRLIELRHNLRVAQRQDLSPTFIFVVFPLRFSVTFALEPEYFNNANQTSKLAFTSFLQSLVLPEI